MLLAFSACAAPSVEIRPDAEDTVLTAPRDHVRAALVSVLEADGYPVRGENDGRVVRTGYREETRGPWNRLLIWRVGVTRSRVEAVLSADSEETTRVSLSVIYESKEHLWSAWREMSPPPHRSADLYLRSVRKALQLL